MTLCQSFQQQQQQQKENFFLNLIFERIYNYSYDYYVHIATEH